MIRKLAATLLLATGPIRGAAGQDSTSVPPAAKTCFRGQPWPTCRSFWITEAGYVARVTSGGDVFTNDFESKSASLELGHLINVTPRAAFGASVSANVVSGVTLAVRSRARYWVNPELALDFAPGLVVAGVPGSPRFTADLSVMYRDRAGLTLQSFVLPTTTYLPDGGVTTANRFVLYAGFKLGSKLGLLGAAADALAVGILFGTYLIVCGGRGCD